MKRWLLVLVLMLLVAAAVGAQAQTSVPAPEYPTLTTTTGWVIDTTNTLGAAAEQQLEAVAEQISQMGHQLGIGVFATCECDPLSFASGFGNHNRLGTNGQSNGIAVVVFTDRANSQGLLPSIGISVGRALQAEFPSERVAQISDATFAAARLEGQWQSGLVQMASGFREGLIGLTPAQNLTVPVMEAQPAQNSLAVVIIVVVFVLVLVGAVSFFFYAFNQERKREEAEYRASARTVVRTTRSSRPRQQSPTTASRSNQDSDPGWVPVSTPWVHHDSSPPSYTHTDHGSSLGDGGGGFDGGGGVSD